MKNRDIYWKRYKTQGTLYIRQWCLSPLQSRHLGTSHSSLNHHQLPHRIFLNLIDTLEISSLSKVILVLGKTTSHRVPNLGCRRPELPGWFDVLPKISAQDMTHELAHGCDEAANHQLPIACLLNHPYSFYRRMVKLNTKFDADSLHYSLSHFDVMDTQTTYSLNGVYRPHWLVQWSCRCLYMCLPVHSPQLPGYMDVMQTVLITWRMTGLFPDTLHTVSYFISLER